MPAEIEEVVVDTDAIEPRRPSQISASAFSRTVRGGANGGRWSSWSCPGRGQRRWSTLPFGVNGSASSLTNADGTM